MLFPMVLLTCRDLTGNGAKCAICFEIFDFWEDYLPPLEAKLHSELDRLTNEAFYMGKNYKEFWCHIHTTKVVSGASEVGEHVPDLRARHTGLPIYRFGNFSGKPTISTIFFCVCVSVFLARSKRWQHILTKVTFFFTLRTCKASQE